MIKVAVTQRLAHATDYVEVRDALDQRWIKLLISLGIWPVVIPNNEDYIDGLFTNENIDGVILTGGENISEYAGSAAERDKVELKLLKQAIKKKIPVLGVCRGMQLIQHYFGVELVPIEKHIATRHRLQVNQNSLFSNILNSIKDVNSYHSLGSYNSTRELIVSANSEDGVVMAVEHVELPIFAHMWHPEREDVLSSEQKEIMRRLFLQ